MSNRLCRATAPTNNPLSKFSHFEIVTMREYSDYNGGTYIDEINTAAEFLDSLNAYDDPFYRIFGVYKESCPKSRKFIADFFSIDDAKNFLYDITGSSVNVISY